MAKGVCGEGGMNGEGAACMVKGGHAWQMGRRACMAVGGN